MLRAEHRLGKADPLPRIELAALPRLVALVALVARVVVPVLLVVVATLRVAKVDRLGVPLVLRLAAVRGRLVVVAVGD